MDLQLWVALLALAVGAYGSYYQRKSVRLMMAQATPTEAGRFNSFGVVEVTVSHSHGNSGSVRLDSLLSASHSRDSQRWILPASSYGMGGSPTLPREFVHIVASGDDLQAYAAHYRLMAAVLIYTAARDRIDENIVVRSGLHEITKARSLYP